MPPIDKLLSQYSEPVRSWPGEEWQDEEARANYAAANPPKLQTEGGSIDKGDLLPVVRYPEAKKSPSEWQSSSDVMRQLDDGWRIEPFSRLMAPFKSMAEAWRTQPVLGPMVRPSQMNPEAFNQMSSDAMTVAGTGMTGGIGRAAVGSPVPHGVTELGIFGGRKAKTADLDALARAEEMVRIGRPREEVWSETGWFQGPDKQWRFEIDDSGMKPVVGMRDWINRENGVTMAPHIGAAYEKAASELTPNAPVRMKRLYDHPELDRAYPHGFTSTPEHQSVMGIPVQLIEGGNVSGFYSKNGWQGKSAIGIHETLPPGPAREAALHELQHAIQGREGFAEGESPSGLLKEASRIPDTPEARALWGDDRVDRAKALRAPDGPDLAMDLYRRHAGETEARAVQARRDLTPEQRRARAPWLDYDVPEKDQIVRFGNESGAMSNKPGLDDLIAETKRQHEFAEAAIQEAIASGNPKLVATRGGDLKSVMTKAPDHDGYRVTTFSGEEPMGHRDYPNTPEGMKGLRQDLVSQGLRPPPAPTLMASIDPLTAAVSPPRQVDPLGYYSPTLDAALRLSQKKGTPEQMLAQLKKAGAKDSEIEVSGLKKMFEGKKSVSQEEIVKALEEGKVGLEEKVYGSPDANAADAAARATEQALREAFEAAGASPMEARMLLADASMGDVPPQYMTREIIPLVEAFQRVADDTESRDLAGGPRWSAHSLDPENPTYREVVLHLPDKMDDLQARKDALMSEVRTKPGEARLQEINNELFAINQEANARKANRFQSGHFDEPNIVGHMMVSENIIHHNKAAMDEITKKMRSLGNWAADPEKQAQWMALQQQYRDLDKAGKARVLTLDQVQSDWGQKLRDGGVRDEAKVADLKARIAEIDPIVKDAHKAFKLGLSEHPDSVGTENIQKLSQGLFGQPYEKLSGEQRLELSKVASENNKKIAALERVYKEAQSKRGLLEAELRTAEAATPGHPLVNTTDQWLNTTLRRAIRMASEEGQDYIAIPSGHTVLSYNPGQEGGMLGFYGGTPQEMSYLVGTLRDVAKTAPDAKVIDALDPKSIDALAKAGILDKKKIEGISVSRVLKNAESRYQGIVPKNLYALLQKLDKATPPPQVIDTLDSPSGKTGLGEGFTLFKITPEAKKAAKESGQPLFRFGGRVTR